MDAYRWLMESGDYGAPFDRHLFACACSAALADAATPPAVGLGLSAEALAALVGLYFPHAPGLLAGLSAAEDGTAPLAPEEPDLRDLLLEGRTGFSLDQEWLAHIIARRSLGLNHLWQDLGLPGRADLGRLLRTHFAPLAARNHRDMKWKKFFYRELCQREGVFICKSPVCDACEDFGRCFGGEDGDKPRDDGGRSERPWGIPEQPWHNSGHDGGTNTLRAAEASV